MTNENRKISRFKALLALTAILYVAVKASGINNRRQGQGDNIMHDDKDSGIEKETISINYDVSELVDASSPDEEITFENIVFRLGKMVYDGMGSDFIEGMKDETKGIKPGVKYDKKENLDTLSRMIKAHNEGLDEEIKYSKTSYKVVIDNPASITGSLRELKNIIQYIEDYMKKTEYILKDPKIDKTLKNLVSESYKVLRKVLRFIVHIETKLAKKLKRSGSEIDAKKIEKVVAEIEKGK